MSPNCKDPPIESSWHQKQLQASVSDLRLMDPHEARALELEALQKGTKARRIRDCWSVDKRGPYPGRTCKQRVCTSCGPKHAYEASKKALSVIQRMANPTATVFSLSTWGLLDLHYTMAELRKFLRTMRRRKSMASVEVAIGFIEMPIARCGKKWNVHLHLIADSDQLDEHEVNQEWRQLTNSRGTFSIEKDRAKVENAYAMAKYITKSESWCPKPGQLDLMRLGILTRAIHGKRLLVEWERGRRSNPPLQGYSGRKDSIMKTPTQSKTPAKIIPIGEMIPPGDLAIKGRRSEPATSSDDHKERFRTLSFTLADTPTDDNDTTQFALVGEAIQKAMEMAGTDKPGHALAMLCIESLGNTNPDNALRLIKVLAETLERHHVAVCDDDGELVLGSDAFEKMRDRSGA